MFFMKIAVLLTGQLRTIAYTKQILLSSFPHADFFLSIDKDNTQQNINLNSHCTTTDQDIEAAIDFFKPKAVFLGEGLIEPYKHIMQYSFSLVRRHRMPENELTYENYLEGEIFQPQKCLIPKVIRRSSYKKIF